jgi:hypothetical protein
MRSFETYPGKLFSTGAPAKPTPPAVKLHSRSLTQVLKWLRRSIARRWVIQDAAIKMDKVNTNRFTPTQLREHAFRLLVLEQQARALDNARDTLEDEITRRKCRASMSFGLHKNGLHHIDPAVRRRAALLRAVGSAQ